MATSYFHYRDGEKPVPDYTLIELIARGGFGEVWKARRPGGFFEALKIIDLSGQHGLKEFASLDVVKTFRHANLVPILGCWLKDENGDIMAETVFEALSRELEAVRVTPSSPTAVAPGRPVELLIAMGLGDKSLHVVLEEYQQQGYRGIPPDELLEYMRASAKAIDFLNTGKPPIVHGDIKPHNILLVGNSAQLCDFGLCTAVQSIRVTQPTPVTVAYAAPELFSGKPTPWSDQYSLAVTYVELRTGRLPFDDETLGYPYQVMDAHKRGLLRLDDLDPEVRKVIRRATSPKSDERWPSAGKLVRELYDAEGLGSRRMDQQPPAPPPIAYDMNKGPGFDPGRYTPREPASETEKYTPQAPLTPPPPVMRKPPGRSVTPPPVPTPPPSDSTPLRAPPPVEEYRPGQTLGRFEPVMLPTDDDERKPVKPLMPVDSLRPEPEGATLMPQSLLSASPPSALPPASPEQQPTVREKIKRSTTKPPLIPPLPDEDRIRARLLLRRRIAALAVAAVAIAGIAFAIKAVFDSSEEARRKGGNGSSGASTTTSQSPSDSTTTTSVTGVTGGSGTTTTTSTVVQQTPKEVFDAWRAEHLPATAAVKDKIVAVTQAKKDLPNVFEPNSKDLEDELHKELSKFIDDSIKGLDDSKETAAKNQEIAKDVISNCKGFLGLFSDLGPEDKAELCIGQIRALVFLGFEPTPPPGGETQNQRSSYRRDAVAQLDALNTLRKNGASLERYGRLQAMARVLTMDPVDRADRPKLDRLLDQFDKSTGVDQLSRWEASAIKRLRPLPAYVEDIEKLIDGGEFAKARGLLDQSGASLNDTDTKYYLARINLSEPPRDAAQARDAEIKNVLGNLPGLLPKLHAAARKDGATEAQKQRVAKLIAALKSFAGQKEVDPYLDLAIGAAEAAAKGAPRGLLGYAESLAEPRAILATRRILRSIKGQRETPPGDLCKQVDADYAVATAQASFVPPSGVDEFWLECQVVQEKNGDAAAKLNIARERIDAREPADPNFRYGRFVLAWDRWSRDRGSDDAGLWLEILANLDKAYGDGKAPPAALETESRKIRAAEILLETIGHAYPREAIVPDGAAAADEAIGRRFGQMFQSADAAKAALAHLDLARNLSPKAAGQRSFRVAHALAAWYSGDDAARQQARSEVSQMQVDVGRLFAGNERPTAERLNDALALLYVGFRSSQGADQAGRANALRFAQSLAELCTNGWPDDEQMAGVLYRQVFGPAEQIADGLLRSPQRPGDLHTFYGDVSRFIDHYQYIRLPDADGAPLPRYKKIEELLNHAINDLGVQNIPEYWIRRGRARTDFDRQVADDKGALSDAEAALKLIGRERNADFIDANGLKGRALLLKSGAADCYRERVQSRSDAAAALRLVTADAELKKLASNDELAEILIRESMVHLEQGNELVEKDARQKELRAARDTALEAKQIVNQRYPEYAETALGNALEDLASQVGEKPDQNFAQAAKAFKDGQAAAAMKSEAAALQRQLDRGRCNLKRYQWLARQSNRDGLKVLERDVGNDLTIVAKNGNLSQQIIAHYHLAELALALGDTAGAEKESSTAIGLAKKSNDPNLALYQLQSAELVIARIQNLGDKVTSATRHLQGNLLRARIKDLAAAPPPKGVTFGISPEIEAKLLEALGAEIIENKSDDDVLKLMASVAIAPKQGCDLTGSERSFLAKRVKLAQAALLKQWSAPVEQKLMADCGLLLSSEIVPSARNDDDSDLTKASIYRVRASVIVLPERLNRLAPAQFQDQVEFALGDFKTAIGLFDQAAQPRQSDPLRYIYAVYASRLPTPKPAIAKQALDYARAALAAFKRGRFPQNVKENDVTALIDKLSTLATQN